MICKKCNAENQEDASFCSKCGANLLIQDSEEKQEEPFKSEFTIFKNKKTILVFASVTLLICAVVFLIVFLDNPVRNFKQDIKSSKYSEANDLYDEKIKGNADKEKLVNTFLTDEVSVIKESFINSQIDFGEAKERLDIIKNTGLVQQEVKITITEIEKINNSRVSYKKGVEFEKAENYTDSIKEFKKVIKEDKNYDLAQKQIRKITDSYKVDVLKHSEDSVNSGDYVKAVSLLKEASSIIPDDNDIIAKLTVYEKELKGINEKEKRQRVENAKAAQVVSVENAKIMVQDANLKALYPDMLNAIITNKSDKTIKKMKVGFLGFDNNGYPVKIVGNFDFSGGNYEFVGDAEDVNIVAGGRFGENVGWELSETHGISKVLALVKSTTFYDGSTWDNPYYQYWIEEYKEKPLH